MDYNDPDEEGLVGIADMANLAKEFAAELIQATFRRHRDCKLDVRIRKQKSSEQLVKNLAAETITSGVRRLARSRSRSRVQSEASSIAQAADLETNLTHRSTASTGRSHTRQFALQLSELSVSDLPKIVWQGSSDIYVVFACQDWTFRTPTKGDSGRGTVMWPELQIQFPIPTEVNSSNPFANSVVTATIMNENLVVADKLIGTAEIVPGTLLPALQQGAMMTTEAVSAIVTAFEGPKFKKKAKGTLSFTICIVSDEVSPEQLVGKAQPGQSMPTPREKLEFRMDSGSVSLASRSVDPYGVREDSITALDFSVAQLRNAADLLHDWETPAHSSSAPIPAPALTLAAHKDSTEAVRDFHIHKGVIIGVAGDASENRASSAAVRSVSKPRASIASLRAKPEAPDPAPRPTAPTATATTGSSKASNDTRLRTRRATATATTAEDVPPSGVSNESATSAASKARRLSTDRTGPPAVASASRKSVLAPKPANEATSVSAQSRRGATAFDEAVRLAMKKKGAFVKLTSGEFARLLETLLFPVRAELLGRATRLSNISGDSGSAAEYVGHGTRTEHCNDDVSLPIVHAMSLAATISFAIRDAHLLAPASGASGRSTPEESDGLITMSESQAERALEYLRGLVDGPRAEIKACVLQTCQGRDNPMVTATVGRASPALSQLTGATVVARRPAEWGAPDVLRFLAAVRIDAGRGNYDLTGELFLHLDHAALRTRFEHNPSLDRTRLAVYVQALKYLDDWWDRGIRPGDDMDTGEDTTEGGEPQRRRKGKRRGSKADAAGAWGDLASVLAAAAKLAEAPRSMDTKIVQGGTVLLSHLLKIADFQPLLEALTPLNRAFAWGCSLEGLVRFASIIGGMRAHLWLPPAAADTADDAPISGSHASIGSSAEEDRSQSSWQYRPGNSEVGYWVVLQKATANSTSELTQLVRLCNELRVVMKYAPREDDFLAYIPAACLRLTSVAELRSKRFEAELEGLLLEDLAVGKHVVVAGAEALKRTCERFDWWDRPSTAALEGMSGQIAEVVSLAEAEEKRRIGVRLVSSGVCDALPLEALRLCTLAEIEALKAARERPEMDVEEAPRKPQRRKSKAAPSESRKTRLRSLISSLNATPEDKEAVRPAPVQDMPHVPTPPATRPPGPAQAQPPPALPASTAARIIEPDNRSELSNLSNEPEDERVAKRPVSAKKKRKSFTSRLYSASLLASPAPLKTVAPRPASPPAPKLPVSPQKRIVRRSMVRVEADPVITDSPFSPGPRAGDQSAPPPPDRHDEVDSELEVSERATADYSWLRSPQRSPLVFPAEIPALAPQPIPRADAQSNAAVKQVEVTRKAGPAALHMIQPGFDGAAVEYTPGVQKYALDDEPDGNFRPSAGAFQPKFVRHHRPQSAPLHKTQPKGPASPPRADVGNEELGIEGNNVHTTAQSSFGLSGVGYVHGGGLQQHANLWVNEHISALADADIPRTIPNKHALPKTDYRDNTHKLFDFHERQLATGGDPFGDRTDGFAGGNFMLGAFAPSKPAPAAGAPKTERIPQRPKSANPTSRGVSKPVRTVDPAVAAAAEALAKLDVGGVAGGAERETETADLNIAGGAPPVVVREASAKGGKRTREEELQHIAQARSNKELSLKEKVLMKELKRLQGREKIVV